MPIPSEFILDPPDRRTSMMLWLNDIVGNLGVLNTKLSVLTESTVWNALSAAQKAQLKAWIVNSIAAEEARFADFKAEISAT